MQLKPHPTGIRIVCHMSVRCAVSQSTGTYTVAMLQKYDRSPAQDGDHLHRSRRFQD